MVTVVLAVTGVPTVGVVPPPVEGDDGELEHAWRTTRTAMAAAT
jgi:hypothetical protein